MVGRGSDHMSFLISVLYRPTIVRIHTYHAFLVQTRTYCIAVLSDVSIMK